MSHAAFGVGHDALGSLNAQLPSKPGNPGCLMAGLSADRHPPNTHTPDPGLPRTHRNLVCWSLCAPLTCLYTSFSCRAREEG